MSILFIFQQIMQIYYLIFKMHVISKVCKVHKGKKNITKIQFRKEVCNQKCRRAYRELFQVSVLCKMIMWTLNHGTGHKVSLFFSLVARMRRAKFVVCPYHVHSILVARVLFTSLPLGFINFFCPCFPSTLISSLKKNRL